MINNNPQSETGNPKPLTYQEFREVAAEQYPKTKTYDRAQLRRMYRDYKKNRVTRNP